MNTAFFRFYAELNDFLAPALRGKTFQHSFHQHPSIKDMIEALGAPHTEVELILANGVPVDFSYQVQDGDRISVYPQFEALDVSSLVRLRPQPLRETRFVADIHLGKLAAYLRMLGFDTLYRNDFSDEQLARLSHGERRILLTRDRGLLKRSLVTHGYCVRQNQPRGQLKEIVQRFDLPGVMKPFQRCLRCNGLLAPVEKQQVWKEIPAKTQLRYEHFHQCQQCRQVYWKGSHYERMARYIREVLSGEVAFHPAVMPPD